MPSTSWQRPQIPLCISPGSSVFLGYTLGLLSCRICLVAKTGVMLRREARLRREYLYRKSIEERERQVYEKKAKILGAYKSNQKVPTELRHGTEGLVEDLAFDEGSILNGVTPASHIDDEYSMAGVRDPKILITTSRDPSSRLSQFSKELSLIFPNSQRINRGNFVISQIVEACKNNSVTDLVMAHEHRGVPDTLIICHLPFGPTAYFSLSNVVLRHDIPDVSTASEAYPHLIFENFTSSLGNRTKNILKYLFPVPKKDAKRVLTWSNEHDFISFRHHVFKKSGRDLELQEAGPRFEMKLFEIRLGTVDNEDAEKEWVYRPYLNTTKKKEFIGETSAN